MLKLREELLSILTQNVENVHVVTTAHRDQRPRNRATQVLTEILPVSGLALNALNATREPSVRIEGWK